MPTSPQAPTANLPEPGLRTPDRSERGRATLFRGANVVGVTPADALRMATLTSAPILGQAGALGEIAPGHRAALVVLPANPLEDVRNTRTIESVWLDGVQVCEGL